MRIAIVDDLDTERTLLKERLVRQLSQRGADAEILEFDSGEAFLAAEKRAALYRRMQGKGTSENRCRLPSGFTTTSTDHALEGFQVRAFHYLVILKPSCPVCWMKCHCPEPVLVVKWRLLRAEQLQSVHRAPAQKRSALFVCSGLLLAYFPVRSYLKQSSAKACGMGGAAAARALPWRRAALLSFRSRPRSLAAHNDCDNFSCISKRCGSPLKSGTIALAVCAVFACLNSLSRAVGTAIVIRCSCRRTSRGSALAPASFIMRSAG